MAWRLTREFAGRLALCVGLWSALPLATARADDVASAVAALPAELSGVQLMGSWKDGATSGVYRLIVSRVGSPANERLFVQWLAVDRTGKSRVVDSAEVEEFASLGTTITGTRSKTEADALLVFIDTAGAAGSGPSGYELILGPPAEYRFAPFSN